MEMVVLIRINAIQSQTFICSCSGGRELQFGIGIRSWSINNLIACMIVLSHLVGVSVAWFVVSMVGCFVVS